MTTLLVLLGIGWTLGRRGFTALIVLVIVAGVAVLFADQYRLAVVLGADVARVVGLGVATGLSPLLGWAVGRLIRERAGDSTKPSSSMFDPPR